MKYFLDKKARTYNRIVTWTMVIILTATAIPFMYANNTYAADVAFESSISGFPESYKTYLRKLHNQYPKWEFKPYTTGIDFSTAVSKEASNNRSLVEKSYNDYLKSNAAGDYNTSTGTYIAKDGSTWVSASSNAVAYFMDPRNFLNESYITMFEQLSYDSSVHTRDGVESILQGSFMYKTNICYLTSDGTYKKLTGTSNLYSARIIEAAKQSKVSPYYLASKILQEIGVAKHSQYAGMGASSSISGTYSGYKGIYNFYNIGANDGTNAVANGLLWAKTGSTYERPWTTPEKSIIGGAKYIGEKYINCGQDTAYFQRFNVRSDSTYSLYTHQYMTNIYGCASEASTTSSAYKSLGIMEKEKTFIIPVYKNMPEETTTVRLGSASDKAGTINATVNMRQGPSTSYDKVITLSTGNVVTVVQGIMTDAAYSVKWLNNPYWYKLKVTQSGKTYTGYVSANYIDVTPELNIIKGVATKIATNISRTETVYYMTDNPAIAVVDSAGNVTGIKAGTTTIRAYTQCGNMSPCTVTVNERGTVLSDKSVTLNIGATKALTAKVYPISGNQNVKWTSSNSAVATVTASGKVAAKAVGTTTISATAETGGIVGKCTVTVIKPVKGVSLNKQKISIAVDSKANLEAIINPTDASIKTVSWKSSNKKIATIKNGVVTGVAPGVATITVTTKNEGKTATCTVTVKPKKTAITSAKSKSYNKVKIKWRKVSDITGYKIYRKTGTGAYKIVARVSASAGSYTDKNLTTGATYKYKVAAYKTVNGKNHTASKSSAKSVKPIPAKTVATVTKTGSVAQLRWKGVSGASGYKIYRKTGSTGTYKSIKTIKSASTITYKNSRLSKNVKYYYKIMSYKKMNGVKIYSNYSKAVSVTG